MEKPFANRLAVALHHSTRYAFEPQARLARDVGVSRSTISRIVAGQNRPSFILAERIALALSADLGVSIQPRDLFSADGTFAEPSGCKLCGCSGCMPENAYDTRGHLKIEYEGMKPGDWSLWKQPPP